MERKPRAVPELYAVDRVRCLECGSTYAKPNGGGTVQENPGCPRCGYLGWIATEVPLRREEPPRSDADLPLRRSLRAH